MSNDQGDSTHVVSTPTIRGSEAEAQRPQPTTMGSPRPEPAAVAAPPAPPPLPKPRFISFLDDQEYDDAMIRLSRWVEHVLLPTYGREVSSVAPWCPQWWNHAEAVAQLHALWLAWEELTGYGGGPLGPANWHRDYLQPVMTSLRDPAGPFASCKAGSHRAKTPPAAEPFPIGL